MIVGEVITNVSQSTDESSFSNGLKFVTEQSNLDSFFRNPGTVLGQWIFGQLTFKADRSEMRTIVVNKKAISKFEFR